MNRPLLTEHLLNKKCSSCDKVKPVGEFHIRRRNRLGIPIYYSRCKSCSKKMTSYDKLRWEKNNRKLGLQLTQTVQINCYTINKLVRGKVVLLSRKTIAVEMVDWDRGSYVLEFRKPTEEEINAVKRTTQSSDNAEVIMSIRDSLGLPEKIDDWTSEQWQVFREEAIQWEKDNYGEQE